MEKKGERRQLRRARLESLESRRVLAGGPLISEFMAANDGGFRDGFDRSPDWIEIHNPGDTPIQLSGYRLTDDPARSDLWTFPAKTLSAGGYLIVFASGTQPGDPADPSGGLHTDFKLDRDGDYLALVSPSGEVISQFGSPEQSYPEQLTNISFGTSPHDGEGATEGYMETPTPGEANVPPGEVLADFVRDTKFSVDRGYFDQPFQLEITTETSGATIRYTTDGTAPSLSRGTVYTVPITVGQTTIVRAIAYRNGYVSTNTDTQTYLFLQDVLTQDGAGLPETWGTFTAGSSEARAGAPVPANYDVDPQVVNDSRYRDTFLSDLRSLPAVSLVLPPNDLWDEETGIYSNTMRQSVEWERAGSVELIGIDGASEFQIDAGIRIHGGFGRRPSATAKHSFRLFFKGIYGDSKLNYPWFGEDHVSEFDTIVLRANYNYSWARGDRGGEQTGKDYTIVNDRWASLAQREMGGLSPEGTYVHLYVNGLYWGIYNPTERPDASFQASHQGGLESEYDVQNHEGSVAGNSSAWKDLRKIVRADPLDYNAVKKVLDVDNFIDYMILNQFGGNGDWPQNNWYASRRRMDGQKWQFHSWDAEFFFVDPGADRIRNIRNQGPGEIYVQLLESDEFRIRFADRIQKHMFNNGALTLERNIQRLDELAAVVDRATVGESARWGDAWMNQVDPARTRDDDWLPRLEELRTDYFAKRSSRVIAQYRRKGIFPDLDAPAFSQFGGNVAGVVSLTLSHPDTTAKLYYTLDGSDPRDASGAISRSAKLYTGTAIPIGQDRTVQARAKDSDEWSAKIEADFFVAVAIPGDVNQDQVVDVADINALCGQIRSGGQDLAFDVDDDLTVDRQDHDMLVEQILGTVAGDANLDGVFNSADLIETLGAGQFQDGVPLNSDWGTGDWNCDGEFDTTDIVNALQAGTFVANALTPSVRAAVELTAGELTAAVQASRSASHASRPLQEHYRPGGRG